MASNTYLDQCMCKIFVSEMQVYTLLTPAVLQFGKTLCCNQKHPLGGRVNLIQYSGYLRIWILITRQVVLSECVSQALYANP